MIVQRGDNDEKMNFQIRAPFNNFQIAGDPGEIRPIIYFNYVYNMFLILIIVGVPLIILNMFINLKEGAVAYFITKAADELHYCAQTIAIVLASIIAIISISLIVKVYHYLSEILERN